MKTKHFQILSDGSLESIEAEEVDTVPVVVQDILTMLIRSGEIGLAQHILSYYTKE